MEVYTSKIMLSNIGNINSLVLSKLKVHLLKLFFCQKFATPEKNYKDNKIYQKW